MDNINDPAINRYEIKQKDTKFVYEGMCVCGSVLYKWTGSGRLFCHHCPAPRKNLKR